MVLIGCVLECVLYAFVCVREREGERETERGERREERGEREEQQIRKEFVMCGGLG